MYFENEANNDEAYNAAVEAARAADSAARRAAEEDRVLRLAAGLPLNERIRYPNHRPTYEELIHKPPPKYTPKAKSPKKKGLWSRLTRRKSPKPPKYVNMSPPDYTVVGGKKKHKHKTKGRGLSLRKRKTIKRRR